MTLDERIEKIGLIPLNDIQEELTPSEYITQDPEKTIEQQWQEIFAEGMNYEKTDSKRRNDRTA